MSTSPNFASTPNIGSCTLTAANTVYDGTGTVGTAFTAGASGSYVGSIRAKPLGTNVASLARVWVNNGGATTTAANNYLLTELVLPASASSAVAAVPELLIQINFALPAGCRITVALATAVAAGWQFTTIGGDL